MAGIAWECGCRCGCRKRGYAGYGFDLDLWRQFAGDAGKMAEGSKGRGIAFNEKDQIASLGKQFDGLFGCP